MNDAVRQQYDSLYANANETLRDGAPLKLLELFQSEVASGRVLDVGGGDGRNALPLAVAGYDVTVVDLSAVGLQKVQSLAEARSVQIETRQMDVTTKAVTGTFAGVVFSFVLHHLDAEAAVTALRTLQAQTEAQGVHVIATFGQAGELADRARRGKRFYPTIAELQELYSGWNILYCQDKETTTLAKNKAGERLKNQAIFFLAKKP